MRARRLELYPTPDDVMSWEEGQEGVKGIGVFIEETLINFKVLYEDEALWFTYRGPFFIEQPES